MKKNILIIIVFSLLSIGFSSAYMEDKVFCTIGKNSITVTLERDRNYKCSEYISVLSQAINTEYNDILSIQKLIKQGYDVEYWKEIRETKKEKLKKILTIKEQIENAIVEFDLNLFTKMKDYVVYTVSPYQTKYKKVLKNLNNLRDKGGKFSNDVTKKIKYLEEDIDLIDKIFESTDYDTLIKNFNKHLYLKNLIEGK